MYRNLFYFPDAPHFSAKNGRSATHRGTAISESGFISDNRTATRESAQSRAGRLVQLERGRKTERRRKENAG
jgi:hypothetical protein